MARKARKKQDDAVKYIVVNEDSFDDTRAQVFDTLKEAEDYFQEGLENEDFEEDFVNDLEIMEVKIVKVHHLYIDKHIEVSSASD